MKYIEYDETTGRILSEITSDIEPETADGIGLMTIEDGEEIDMTHYSVVKGSLMKTAETSRERAERERIRREHAEQCFRRLRSLKEEFIIALIAEDTDEMKRLRKEFRRMKAYI